jgi:hypothetical protein
MTVNATGRSLCSLSGKQEEMQCNGDDILRSLIFWDTVQHPSGDYTVSSTILPLRLTIISKVGMVRCCVLWRGRNVPDLMLVLFSPVHCATLQKIKNWTTPRQMPTILQDNTLLQLGMCLASQIWFVHGVRWSVTDSKQNSEQCRLNKNHVAARYQNIWSKVGKAVPLQAWSDP